MGHRPAHLARREDSVVIGGHQRLVAARRVGLTEVPVTYLDIAQEQAPLLNLALNRIAGSWDDQLLARLLADLGSVPDLDLSLSGFGQDAVADLLRKLAAAEKADRAEDFDVEAALEEAEAEPRSRPGDLWLLGEHRLLCGDATSTEDVARLLLVRSQPSWSPTRRMAWPTTRPGATRRGRSGRRPLPPARKGAQR